MRFFYVIEPEDREIKRKLKNSIFAISFAFALSVIGIFSITEQMKTINIENSHMDLLVGEYIFEIIELDWKPHNIENSDDLVQRYIESRGELSIFDELFNKRINGNNG